MYGFGPKSRPNLHHEVQAGFPKRWVIGVDEVGRGCLAGPVVASAFALPIDEHAWRVPADTWLKTVRDSKLVDAEERTTLDAELRKWGPGFAIAEASVTEIDTINILHASMLAMKRAAEELIARLDLKTADSVFLVDGNRAPAILHRDVRAEVRTVVEGDLKCLSIACASIIAKVYRDDLMRELDEAVPGYGFARHKGYPTPEHRRALKGLGVTVHHRRSFGPVRECCPPAVVSARIY